MHDRRSFLKLGAGAAVGGIAAALPSAVSATECASNIKWDETRDVIVVGSGFAGLSSALNAKRQGLGSILVLEKMQVIGGNSAINGAG